MKIRGWGSYLHSFSGFKFPGEKKMKHTRDEYHEIFRRITNMVKPEHPYVDDPYPIQSEELYTTWKRSDSSSWAHCGPRDPSFEGYKVSYAVDLGYYNNHSVERVLCITNHELTHIEEGSHTQGSAHNPTFWEAVVRNAKTIIDNYGYVEGVIGEFDIDKFIEEVCEEPNHSMTDGRTETPEERREKMWEGLGRYRP